MKNFTRLTYATLGLVLAVSTSMVAAAPGADTFQSRCAACHGETGSADTAMGKSMHIKDLSSAEVQSKTDAQLNEVITVGQKPMPGYQEKLTGDQISDLVKYIRTLKK